MNKLFIATRKSPLAMWQAEFVKTQLMQQHPQLAIELIGMSTQGDVLLDVPLAKIGGKGLFIKELEEQMLAGNAQLAVHSMKDLPAVLPEGFAIGAVMARHNPLDAFVSNTYASLDELPQGAIVGTSSLRRKSQLLAVRPDLQLHDLRGNIHTRMRKLDEGQYDAIILAAAGLERMGLPERIRSIIAAEVCLPAVAQGALAIEVLANDSSTQGFVDCLNDESTLACVRAERAMNAALEGGCQVPIGSYAIWQGEQVWLRGLVASLDGKTIIRGERKGSAADAQAMGEDLAQELLANGAKSILDVVYGRA
ncbi:MAG: hydroxymethylbilane synthase [Thiotrichales bacterium 32-46-8]|nr:hydroxymethylbilane synthase [Gammaproteobacteria bacterium]OYX05826.1 MAG: hydroxymethylbilane synthase [Thiotrichales bacterium 32-46-8]OYZ07366.1 MAG: hydroxymethylbilane synthase [Thiotrichales bacterium 16-46-22]OYZ42705.1 MAG: hydroxymethylbilane synthase [Thiotrichales bacterium 24-47-4]OZA17513.1 MAG: hydroxymethylbilane synthase [Thiotrichales bacterium 17-46-47]OZA75341.1 MAG: hydroxymethylbilane synthase [Thiotrichales bacterium 39-47-5]OZA96317.1 MAG: hydroxymethylbilane syntha